MSGTKTLVYKKASVDLLSSDLEAMRVKLEQDLDSLFTSVDAQLTGWSEATVSRQAERQFKTSLKESLDSALTALTTLRSALGEAQEMAETAETRNIALLA